MVLLVHSSGWYNRGKPWGIPKGTIDPGETPEQAARRETWEETGVVAPEVLIPLGSIRYTNSRKQIHAFAGSIGLDVQPSCASWEVDQVEFVTLEQARRLLHPDQIPLVTRLEKLIAEGPDAVVEYLES